MTFRKKSKKRISVEVSDEFYEMYKNRAKRICGTIKDQLMSDIEHMIIREDGCLKMGQEHPDLKNYKLERLGD